MPYVREPFAEQRIWQGLPFPVSCCWNGMAVLSAAPFQNGTRFRADDPEGCPSSECSLICDDFIRAGHTKMVVDPGGPGLLKGAWQEGMRHLPGLQCHMWRGVAWPRGTVLLRAAPVLQQPQLCMSGWMASDRSGGHHLLAEQQGHARPRLAQLVECRASAGLASSPVRVCGALAAFLSCPGPRSRSCGACLQGISPCSPHGLCGWLSELARTMFWGSPSFCGLRLPEGIVRSRAGCI